MSSSRRDFLLAGMSAVGGAMIASCRRTSILDVAHADGSVVPWPYTSLDPKATAQSAYVHYFDGCCMFGPFRAVIGALGEAIGAPHNSFPFDMMRYGANGAGVSSMCGTLNASAAVMGLLIRDDDIRSDLILELFNWYEQTELPSFIPDSPVNDFEIAKSTTSSNLCHVSISKWCTASGHTSSSEECYERCARLSADVTEKLVQLLNDHFSGNTVALFALPYETQACRSCHDRGGTYEDTRARMSCHECHQEQLTDHYIGTPNPDQDNGGCST